MEQTSSCARKCHWCSRPESESSPLLRCSTCKDTLYCNQNCQKWDYKSIHKKVCQTFFASSLPEEDIFYGPMLLAHSDSCDKSSSDTEGKRVVEGIDTDKSSGISDSGFGNKYDHKVEYVYVLLRTRNDEIHFHNDLSKPKKGCVYEILCCVSDKDVLQRYPELDGISPVNGEEGVASDDDDDDYADSESADSKSKGHGEPIPSRRVGWVRHKKLKECMLREHRSTWSSEEL
jgi:hypothetical protein